MKPYTYLIKHVPTDTFYYGVRWNHVKRKRPIVEDLWVKYFTSSLLVQDLIKQYGKDSFLYEVRREFDSVEQAMEWEKKVLRRCKVLHNPKWINANVAGRKVVTKFGRAKISKTHKGVSKSEEHKLKISKANKGQKKSPSMFNEEYRKKMSNIKSGKGNAMYGKHHSEETRRKISEANKGRPAHNKGVPQSEEAKRKQSLAMKGRKKDPELIKRIADKVRGSKREKKYCPHCNRMISVGWYYRHGDNCRMKK